MSTDFSASRLAVGAGELWEAGTRAAFLDAIGDGSLPSEAFQRWLVQDYLFVRGLTDFVAAAAARTPRPEQRLLITGLMALDQELEWFQEHARRLNLELETPPHPVCRRYVDFLRAAAYSRPFQVLLAMLYGVEVAYTVAWGRLTPEGPYAEFIERWTHQEFAAYVASLMEAADANHHPGQQEAFDQVMRHEAAFWRMTYEDEEEKEQ